MASKTPETKLVQQKIIPGTESAALNSHDDFEDPNVGETFGGSYDRLNLSENEVSPLLTYVKNTKIQLEDQKEPGKFVMVSVPVARSSDGKLFSLPIDAIFVKNWKEAAMDEGDTFKVKRCPDATKARGAGAGRKMRSFAIKVYSRKNPASNAGE
jgi:hypothetical protein